MTVVNMHEAKTNLSKLVKRAAAGEEIIVAKAGEPVAKIVAYTEPAKKPRVPGALKGQIWIAPDFDEIPEEFEEYLP
jgi:prevent-host-death family protein